MQLGAKILNSSSTVNNLMYQSQTIISPGETADILFQLVDLDSNKNNPSRYIPINTPITITAIFRSINNANTLTKIASQPFSQDGSIWKISLNTTETNQLAGVNMELTLSEGSAIKKALVPNAVIVNPKSPYQC